jgi:hypothetical protein
MIMSWLRLTATSNCFLYSSATYTQCLSTLICCLLVYSSSLTQFTHSNRLRFWVSASLVDSKWCHYAMFMADGHLKLLPVSILDIYTVFEHIDMMSIGIQLQPYTVTPTLFGSDFGVMGHLWSQNDVIKSWLRLAAISNCFPHPS